ncbi:MAG: hypothetical protein CMC15_17665 [Flavobacteriaceae bacterium]|nr:hypothetical protein [Flavobacteriaceae bacterium]
MQYLINKLNHLKKSHKYGYGDIYSGPNPDVCDEHMKQVQEIEKELGETFISAWVNLCMRHTVLAPDLMEAYQRLVSGDDFSQVKEDFMKTTEVPHSIAGAISFYGRKMQGLTLPGKETLQKEYAIAQKKLAKYRERERKKAREPSFFPFQGKWKD